MPGRRRTSLTSYSRTFSSSLLSKCYDPIVYAPYAGPLITRTDCVSSAVDAGVHRSSEGGGGDSKQSLTRPVASRAHNPEP